MLDPDFLASLPPDDEKAFVIYSNAAYDKLQRAYEYAEQMNISAESDQQEYMSTMLAGIAAFNVAGLSGYSTMSQQFVNHVRQVTATMMIRHSRQVGRYTVAFDAATKLKLRHHLDQIREVVDNSHDTESKKDALRACIAALAAEIDMGRSSFEQFTDVVGALGNLTRETWDKVSPMVKVLMGTVHEAKEKEIERLPAPTAKKQIEDKTKRNGFDKQLDDEVPF